MKSFFCFFLVALMVLSCACTAVQPGQEGSSETALEEYMIPMYYTNEDHTSLIREDASVSFSSSSSAKQRLDELIGFMLDPSTLFADRKDLYSVIPEDVYLKSLMEAGSNTGDVMNGGNILRIEMAEEYLELSSVQQLIFRTGFSQTIFSASDISRIDIYVRDGESVTKVDQVLSTDRMIIDQYDEGFYRDELKVTLYFANRETDALVAEERVLRLGMTESLAMGIVRALIDGPQDQELVKTLPEGTKVNDIVVEDGVCYIDLNDKFQLNHSGGEMAEKLTIYSLVNSLGKINGINYVQILIEGKKADFYKTYVPIDSFLEPDLTLIRK